MHIAFDVDGVLANFSKGFCAVLKDLFNIDIDPTECRSWHWWEWVDGLTEDMENQAWRSIFDDHKYRHFWTELEPLCTDADVKRINALSKEHVVTFITSRTEKAQHQNVCIVTQAWLHHEGFRAYPNVFISSEKGKRAKELGVHVMIDDNGPNAIDLLDAGIATALLRRPYNESFVELVRAKGGVIVNSLDEFIDLCMKTQVHVEDYQEILAQAPLAYFARRLTEPEPEHAEQATTQG